MARRYLLVACLPGCIGGLTTGAVTPVGPTPTTPAGTTAARYTSTDQATGVELRIFGATDGFKDNPLMPNAYGVTYRQIGDEHSQEAGQIGWAGAVRLGSGALFGRLVFDVINTQRTMDGDRKYNAFSPTLDIGVLPMKNGLCFSASATYDVHFDDPDRWLLGVFAGVCASDTVRK